MTQISLKSTSSNSNRIISSFNSAPVTNKTDDVSEAVRLNDANQLSSSYIAHTGMRKSLADTPNPEQVISGMLASGEYVLSPMETNKSGYTHSISKVGLAGGRKLADTIAMLDNCLKTGQKVVFVSYRWSKETDPQVDRLCESLTKAGIIVLRDKESFEAGERIDEYMETIKHPAVVQTIILADNEDEKGCYVKSRNCMNEMQLAFRNKALADAHVTLVPLSDKSIEEYTLKANAIIEDWQGRKDQFIQDGNFIEAGVADNVINNTKTFIRQLSVQNSKTLAQIERSGYKDLVDRINNTPVRPDNRNRSLPFRLDPHYIANPMEHALIDCVAPNQATLLVGAKQSGKTSFVEQSLLKMGADLFELFPNGVITIDALGKSQAELLQTISNASGTLFIVDNLESELSAIQVQELLSPANSSQANSLAANGLLFTSTTDRVSGIPKLELIPLTTAQQVHLLKSYLTTYIPKYSEEQLVQIAKLCNTPLEIATCGNYLIRTNMPMAFFLHELGQDKARILSATGGQIQQARSKTTQQVTSQTNEAKTSELMAALDESLKNKQKVVLFSDFAAPSSNTDNDEVVHTGAKVAQQLRAAGIMVIQANHSRDTYLQILNHKAVVQSVIVVDKNYLYDTSCMLAMEAIFRNEHLTTGRVTLIPASGDLYVAYQRNLGELERYWQMQPQGEMILGNIPLFLRAMGMQNSQMLAGVEQENSKTIIGVIEQTKPVETKPLPFTANPNYVGRVREQDWIMENLAPGRVLTLVGEGGLGKSALTRQTIASIPQDIGIMYPEGVLMVDFEAQISVEQAMTQIVRCLEPGNDGKDIPGSYKRVVANRPALILLDATENIKADELNQLFLPAMKSSIIVTTRRSSDAPDDRYLLKLAHLSKSEQETLLLSYVAHYDATQEQRTLNSILDILGGLPIAIELAGSYLETNPTPLAEFLNLLKSNPSAIGSQVSFLTEQNVLQLDKLALKTVAHHILKILTSTVNLALPYSRIKGILTRLHPNLDDHVIYNDVLRHMYQLGLIKPIYCDKNSAPGNADTSMNNTAEGGFAIVHALVYSYLKSKFAINTSAYRDYLEMPDMIKKSRLKLNNKLKIDHQLYQAVASEYERWLTGAKDQWLEIDEQMPHLLIVLDSMIMFRDFDIINGMINKLVTKVSYERYRYYIFNAGSYDVNLKILQLKLEIGNRTRNWLIVADSYNSMGELQHKFAIKDMAIQNYNLALKNREDGLGKDHPDVATTLHNIADARQVHGAYEIALELYTKALVIRKAKLGEDHPDVASTLNAMANIYYTQGRYDQALELYQQAYVIYKCKLGENHTEFASTLNNTARVLNKTGRHNEAIKLYDQALKIQKSILGATDLHVATTLNGMADVFYNQGIYDKALGFHNQALEIINAKLGQDHPDIGNVFNSIALIYNKQGKYDEAIKLYKQVLNIQKHDYKLGRVKEESVTDSSNYRSFREALLTKKVGSPFTQVNALNGMADVFYNQHMYDKALKYYRQAESLVNHDLATTAKGIANSLYAQGKYEDTFSYYSMMLMYYADTKQQRYIYPDITTLSRINSVVRWFRNTKGNNWDNPSHLIRERLTILLDKSMPDDCKEQVIMALDNGDWTKFCVN